MATHSTSEKRPRPRKGPRPLERALASWLKRLPYLGPRLDPHRVDVTLGAGLAALFRGLDAVFGLLFNLALARACGPGGSGAFFLALGTASVAMVFGRMGLASILMRMVAGQAAAGRWGRVKGTYRKSLLLGLCFSIPAAAALYLCAPLLAQAVFHKPEVADPIRWASFTVVPGVLMGLQSQALRGLGKIRDSLLVDGLSVPALGLLALLVLGHFLPGLEAALFGQVLAVVFACLLAMRLWRWALSGRKGRPIPVPASELTRSSLPLFWVAFVSLVSGWSATFALGAWATKEDVGVYGIALRMASMAQWFLFAVNQSSNPKFARFLHLGDREALRRTANFSGKAMTLLSLPATLLLLAFPRFFLGFFGEHFKAGAAVLVILVLGNFVKVAAGNSNAILIMGGRERLVQNRAIAVAAIAVGMNLLLVPRYGILGAAISTAFCAAFSNLVTVWLVWREFGIWTFHFLWMRPRSKKKG